MTKSAWDEVTKNLELLDAQLRFDNPEEYRSRVGRLLEWVLNLSNADFTARTIDLLLTHTEDKENDLRIRLAAVDALTEIAPMMPDRVNTLISIAIDEEEHLRLRWDITDAYRSMRPDLWENLQNYPDLVDRSVDPYDPPPKLDFSKARVELAQKQSRQMLFYPPIVLVIFGALMGTMLSIGSSIFLPLVVAWIVLIIAFFCGRFVLVRRCPECGRFWARIPLKAVDGYNGPSMPIGSVCPGGSPARTSQRVTVYEVRCRFCRHPWIILR